ncbi:hypothetical protein ACJ41O_009298 [Fusarium nematophilum]
MDNAHHLQELELDLVNWKRHQNYEGDDPDEKKGAGYFGYLWKRHLDPGTPTPHLAALTPLSLSHVLVAPALVDGINFDRLRSLTLRSCPGWSSFIKRAAKLGSALRLKTLEIEGHGASYIPPELVAVRALLDAFLGLESINLSVEGSAKVLPLWIIFLDTETL